VEQPEEPTVSAGQGHHTQTMTYITSSRHLFQLYKENQMLLLSNHVDL